MLENSAISVEISRGLGRFLSFLNFTRIQCISEGLQSQPFIAALPQSFIEVGGFPPLFKVVLVVSFDPRKEV